MVNRRGCDFIKRTEPKARMVNRRGCDFIKRTEPKARMVTRRVSEVELDSVQSSLTRRVSNLVTLRWH